LPVTFLAHQAPVLPLKLAGPRRWNGTGLVIGSMMPDLAYATMGSPLYVQAHDLGPQLWFDLPVGMVVTLLVRRVVAPVVAAHLPDRAPWHLRDYAALGRWPTGAGTGWRPWLVLAVSVLVGSLSHVALDSFTHSSGWVVENAAPLRAVVLRITVFDWLQFGLSFVGSVASLAMLRRLGRRRLLRATYGPPPLEATAASDQGLRRGLAVSALAGLLVMLATLEVGGRTALIVRPVVVAGVTLCGACHYARQRMVQAVPSPARP
jgi:hypothetical protein